MQRIDGVFVYQNQLPQTGQGIQGTAAEGTGAVRREMPQMAKGTIFEGTVTAVKGNQVQLSLTNGQSVQARLESGVQVRMGEPVLFEVKSNQDGQMMIRQVPVKSAYNPTLQRALSAAGMPVTQRNLDMVDLMMQNQMPINKESLSAMARQLLKYPGVDPQTLIQMQKLGFSIDQESVAQFESYKAGEHALLDRFSQMMDQLPELIGAGGDAGEMQKLQNQLLDILEIGGTGQNPKEIGGMPDTASGNEGPVLEAGNTGDVLGVNGQALNAENVLGVNGGPGGETGNVLEAEGKSSGWVTDGIVKGTEPGQAAAGQTGEIPASSETAGQTGEILASLETAGMPDGYGEAGAKNVPVQEFLSPSDTQSLEQQLRQLPGMEEDGRLFTEGGLNRELSAREMLSLIRQNLAEAGSQETGHLKELFQGKGYQGLLKQAMAEQWLLEPGQVEQKEEVARLYERINRQMAKLEQFLQDTGKDASAVHKQVNQVRGNLEMMNQINQLYNYVQLPLKLHNQNAHSDLYVYTNKKRLQDRDGELSALLHLELDHLGTTDVQIKMRGSNVTADFYLSDAVSYRLLEQHTQELQERLEEKGYQCSLQLENRIPKKDFVQDFLEQEAPAGQLSRYSFDVLT